MRFNICFLALSLTLAMACMHANLIAPHDNATAPPHNYIIGTDGPADPATRGYFINHACLVVSNLTASRDWYNTVLGMRHVFTLALSDQYSLMYMGHAQGGRNGTGFQTGAELARDKNNLGGLVEFIQYKKTPRKYIPAANTFSHLGLIVDNLSAAQTRFDGLGVEIVKRTGDLDFDAETGSPVLASAWGFDDFTSDEGQAAIKAILPALGAMGFRDLIVIADPDGNLFEVQALVPTSV